MRWILAVIFPIIFATAAFGKASITPAFGKFSSAGGSVDAGTQGTNTMQVIGATFSKPGGKPTMMVDTDGQTITPVDVISKGPLLDIRSFMSPSIRASWGSSPSTTNVTTAMVAAHATGRRVYYPDGTYLFTGSNLNLAGGIERQSENGVVFTNGRYNGVIQFDRSGVLIGLQHNHLEAKATADTVTPAITTGNIVAPPTSNSVPRGSVDIIAYWYQDFGLDAIRSTAVGSHKWYTWEWGHTDATVDLAATPAQRGYIASRHPLLGWYRGDDQNVLDWQCYWLREAGVSAVVVQPRAQYKQLGINSDWITTSGIDNWIYKLLYSVPNAAGLGIIPWVEPGSFSANYGDSTWASNVAAAWDNNITVIHSAGRGYTVTSNGKNYLTLYLWDGESLRGDLDNYIGSTNTQTFLAARAATAQALGYDGIAVMARHPTSNTTMPRGNLLANGVLYFGAAYSTSASTDNNTGTYSDAVTNWSNDVPLVSVPAVRLEGLSSSHPSNWAQTGSTPDLFQQMLSKAVRYVRQTPDAPKIVTVYNVSEWAEGGASLQPTLGAGWRYLDAVRNALSAAATPSIPEETYPTYYKPTGTIPVAGTRIAIGSDYDQTFTFTPFLSPGTYEGQTVILINYNPVPDRTLVLPDARLVSGSNIYFKGENNVRLGPWETVTLMWIPAKGWVQIGESATSKTIISSAVASGSAVSLTNNAAKNVTSIALPAGTWDVSGNINFAATGATVTSSMGGVSAAFGTLPTDGTEVHSAVQLTTATTTNGVSIPSVRLTLTGNTNIYLVGKCSFSAGSVSAYGNIAAKLVR